MPAHHTHHEETTLDNTDSTAPPRPKDLPRASGSQAASPALLRERLQTRGARTPQASLPLAAVVSTPSTHMPLCAQPAWEPLLCILANPTLQVISDTVTPSF